jgi:hypothetical protein
MLTYIYITPKCVESYNYILKLNCCCECANRSFICLCSLNINDIGFINFLIRMKLYSSPSIVRVIKERRMRWAGHVARMWM